MVRRDTRRERHTRAARPVWTLGPRAAIPRQRMRVARSMRACGPSFDASSRPMASS
ncbi:Hypothetical protein A7982_08481 [Minicystis rosea]|nr:Hypothetical protein A7982_08481 [Minicystis rosea]